MESMSDKMLQIDIDARDGEPARKYPIRIPGQRNPDRTRRAILDAATQEFVAKGFAGASVNEIAERAQVNKRMLYHYFGKKDELYIAVLERVFTSFRSGQVQKLKLNELSPVEAIRELVFFTWNYHIDNPDFMRLMIIENMHDGEFARRSERITNSNAPLREALREVLKRGQVSGLFREDADSTQIYLTISALCSFHLTTNRTLSRIAGRDLSSNEALDTRLKNIVDFVLGYLRPETSKS